MQTLPKFWNYGKYASSNYGAHTLAFQDVQGNEFYFSYKTLVAFCKRGGELVCSDNVWGVTTGKHLNWIMPNHSTRLPYAKFAQEFKSFWGSDLM